MVSRSTTLVGRSPVFGVLGGNVILADFILYLLKTKKLSISTISGYMSAITSVRRLNSLSNLLDHPVVRDLLRAIKLQQAQLPNKTKLPAWNLSFVLRGRGKSCQ